MSNTRTKNAMRNSMVALVSQLLYIVVSFVCRTVFTKVLGTAYLGINGLFTNILTILSFAELGIGSALVYRMYKPLASNNVQKVAQYVNLYKKVYNYIMLIITVIGLAIVPFLQYLVDAPNVKENIILLYLLYLMDTITSYMFVYKKSVLIADQKDYIVSIYTQIFNIIMNVLQMIILVLTHSFIIYCLIRTACNVLNNLVTSRYVDKHYPDIERAKVDKLSKNEIISLKEDVKGLMLRQVAAVSFDGTDNIIISKFIGITTVGVISNYTLLTTTFNGIMNKIFSSITASIGNLTVEGDKDHIESVLKKLFFINMTLYGFLSVGLYTLLHDFVTKIWLNNQFYLTQSVIFIMVLEVFLRGIHYPLFTTRNASGKFYQLKWMNLVCAILNIVLDLIFVQFYGLIGVYIATLIAYVLHRYADIYVVYKYIFNKSVLSYYKMVIKSLIYMMLCSFGIQGLFNYIPTTGILMFIVKIIVVTIIYWIGIYILYRKTSEYKYFKKLILGMLKL
ncbi:lipopolysaccharide biosynthesis protein [Ligilactobacillus ceti]|uniref:Oligosaccharide translocase n=1 Tax=Ligilactobacillus ceti DSM 22408 TaxID=1122146 RepID=A0A0R2KGC3_9LACO|nr:polysaccharide biosynthesis C-terminal domain-containing protein [Ligilactobacillus ceti]KRN88440.1 oligosaccharide translocase [Ligilactobacillus ceti DSM 22408]